MDKDKNTTISNPDEKLSFKDGANKTISDVASPDTMKSRILDRSSVSAYNNVLVNMAQNTSKISSDYSTFEKQPDGIRSKQETLHNVKEEYDEGEEVNIRKKSKTVQPRQTQNDKEIEVLDNITITEQNANNLVENVALNPKNETLKENVEKRYISDFPIAENKKTIENKKSDEEKKGGLCGSRCDKCSIY